MLAALHLFDAIMHAQHDTLLHNLAMPINHMCHSFSRLLMSCCNSLTHDRQTDSECNCLQDL